MSDDDLGGRVARQGERVASLETAQEELQRQSRKHFDIAEQIRDLLTDLKVRLAVNVAADKIRSKDLDGSSEKLDRVLEKLGEMDELRNRVETLENVSKAYVRVIEVISFFSDARTRKVIRWCVLAIVGLAIFFFDDVRAVVSSHASRTSVLHEVPKVKE